VASKLSDENLEKRERLWAWFDIPQRHRGCRVNEKLKELGIPRNQYTIWKRDYAVLKEQEHTTREIQARADMEREVFIKEAVSENKKKTGRWTVDDRVDEADPDKWLQAQVMNLYRAVGKSATGGNAQSQKLLAQLMGILVEKKEITVGLTADEHARIRREAEDRVRDLNRGADGTTSLLTTPVVLSEKLCQDSGQDKSEDN